MADSYSHTCRPASHACMPRIAAPSWLSIGTPAFAVIAFLRRWRERAQQINPKQQQPRTHPSRINPIAPPTIGAARRLTRAPGDGAWPRSVLVATDADGPVSYTHLTLPTKA